MSYKEIELDRIRPSGFNPRKIFDGKKFDEMVASIRAKGVLQPIVVRPIDGGTAFEIVCGERRYRASTKIAEENGGVKGRVIPCMIRNLTDDEAYDVMTIENLQREDLSELEEAQSFKSFIGRYGEEAVKDLAERTGIDRRYIRRRVRVLTLPAKILESWESGKLSYGHLEQLRRLESEKEILDCFKNIISANSWEARELGEAVKPVAHLKKWLDERSVELKFALFEKGECRTCSGNTLVQKEMFGLESARAACLDPACFKQKQNDWLMVPENWKTTKWAKAQKTNGFRFDGKLDYQSYEAIYQKAHKDCLTCPNFCSIIPVGQDSMHRNYPACVDPSCYRKKFQHERGSGTVKEKAVVRAKNHGEQFREVFYEQRLPMVAQEIPPDDVRIARITLVAMMHKFHDLAEWFRLRHKGKKGGKQVAYWYQAADALWPLVQDMDLATVREEIKAVALKISLATNYGAKGRYLIGQHLAVDLAKEWRITEDYLRAKTIKEIHGLASKLGFWKEKKAQTYLFEKLGKKRGGFESCKKSQLIEIVLKSGIDLAGMVPAEILEVGK